MWTISCLRLKAKFNTRFKMTDLGPCTYYLGMTITRDQTNRIIRLGQAGWIEKFIHDHGMWDAAKATPTPMGYEKYQVSDEDHRATEALRTQYQSVVVWLMYAMMGIRPDIAYAVSVVSRYSSNPNDEHWMFAVDT